MGALILYLIPKTVMVIFDLFLILLIVAVIYFLLHYFKAKIETPTQYKKEAIIGVTVLEEIKEKVKLQATLMFYNG